MVGRTNLVSVGFVGKKECRQLSIPGKNSVGHFPALEKKFGHFPTLSFGNIPTLHVGKIKCPLDKRKSLHNILAIISA